MHSILEDTCALNTHFDLQSLSCFLSGNPTFPPPLVDTYGIDGLLISTDIIQKSIRNPRLVDANMLNQDKQEVCSPLRPNMISTCPCISVNFLQLPCDTMFCLKHKNFHFVAIAMLHTPAASEGS